MLKEFYNYLAEKTIKYFESEKNLSSNKYILKLDVSTDVTIFFDSVNSFLNNQNKRETFVQNESTGYSYSTTAFTRSDGIKIIIVPEINITSAYMTRLRNIDLKNKVLFLVCHNPIDSISGGVENLEKEGNLLYRKNFDKQIKNDISNCKLNKTEKEVLNFYIDCLKNRSIYDEYSLKDYSAIISVLNKGKIDKEDFVKFELFFDEELINTIWDKHARERIEENHRYYSEISDVVYFGDIKNDLEGKYSDSFIDKINNDINRWSDNLTYNDVIESIEKVKKHKEDFNLKKISIYAGDILTEKIDYFVKLEAKKGLKSKKIHILVCLDKLQMSSNLKVYLSFSKNVDELPECNKCICENKNRNKDITISTSNNNFPFFKVVFKKSQKLKYEFNFCVINCEPNWINEYAPNYLVRIKNSKNSKNSKDYLELTVENKDIIFNREVYNKNGNGEDYDLIDGDSFNYIPYSYVHLKVNEDTFSNDYGSLSIKVNFEKYKLPITIKTETPKNISIAGSKIQQIKIVKKQNFLYLGNNRINFGIDSYNTREKMREALLIESYLIKERVLFCKINNINDFEAEKYELEISNELKNKYELLFDYFDNHNTVPSLAYFDDELVSICKGIISQILSEFDQLEDHRMINEKIEDILKIGTVKFDNIIAWSSIHPINIIYQVLLSEQVISSTAVSNIDEVLSNDIVKKLNANDLIPFIRDESGDIYSCVPQGEVPQWLYYYPKNSKKVNGKKEYVSHIVKEKIKSFQEHFKYLFEDIGNDTIIIDVVNLGDCENVFIGIIDYFKSNYDLNPLNIDLYIYNDNNIRNAFDKLSNRTELRSFLVEKCGIKENKKYTESEFINFVFNHINYYHCSEYDSNHYSHIAFIEMNQREDDGHYDRNEVVSGTMLDGLVSGISSMYYPGKKNDRGGYRTGFGSKFCEGNNDLITLANYYNDLMNVFGTKNPYIKCDCMSTHISDESSQLISNAYVVANWVVFIDPKVDLHYFKNEKNKDLIIIHYSDQKSSSSGYDAITVTQKVAQYEHVLKEFFKTSNNEVNEKEIIDLFNAINGEWLLNLLSRDDNYKKEKISILAATKLILSITRNDNIIWIPISIEEILRVSGSVGLSKSNGLFSSLIKKEKGNTNAYSDDLLLFGIELLENKVFVHIYPVEVKIGYENSNEETKATKQIQTTNDLLKKYLMNDNTPLQTKFYRNFFAQLAINSADKISMYGLLQDYEKIIQSEIHGKLLNNDFEISNRLENVIGLGIIVSFKEGTYARNIENDDGITTVKFLKDDVETIVLGTDKKLIEFTSHIDCVNNFRKKLFAHENYDNISIERQGTELKFENLEVTVNVNTQKEIITDEQKIDNSYNDLNTVIENKKVSLLTESSIDRFDIQNILTTEELTYCSDNSNGMKILFGTNENTSESLYWYPNNTSQVMHTNTGIIGTMGTGKTQFTKSLIYQLLKENKNNLGDENLGILIFDYKGDYNQNKKDFVDATNAKVYTLYHLPFNPFSISVSKNPKPMLPLHIANTFRDTITKAYGLGNKQVAFLKDCIMKAYEQKGIIKNNSSTWLKEAPTFSDVYNIYRENENTKDDSLHAALTELNDYEIFEDDYKKVVPLYELIKGVTVIDLSGYNQSIQNLIVAITLDLFYNQMQSHGHSKICGDLRQLTKFILVDEADNFLKMNFASLRKILKEGREFGVGTILSTQFLTHFSTSEEDYSKYMYTWIVHNVADLTNKEIRSLFNTTSKQQEDELFNLIKKLNKHHSIVKFGDSSKPIPIKDCAFWEIMRDIEQNN